MSEACRAALKSEWEIGTVLEDASGVGLHMKAGNLSSNLICLDEAGSSFAALTVVLMWVNRPMMMRWGGENTTASWRGRFRSFLTRARQSLLWKRASSPRGERSPGEPFFSLL